MLRLRRHVASSFALALALVGCRDITGLHPLRITVAVTPDRIAPGDSAAIVVRFTNMSAGAVDLALFCEHLFEVANSQGEVVAGREPLYCIAIVGRPVVLGPFESLERRFSWTGTSPAGQPLPPGLYRVYGKLAERRSAPADIEIDAPVP
jgi:hypothetical protein